MHYIKTTNDTIIAPHHNNPSSPINPTYNPPKASRARTRAYILWCVHQY